MAKYLVWCPDLGSEPDDGKELEASDPHVAATKWAEQEDAESADYWIVGGKTATVRVREMKGGQENEYFVSGETVACYTARMRFPANPAQHGT